MNPYIVEEKVPVQLKTGRWQHNTTTGGSYLVEVEDYQSKVFLAKGSLGEYSTVGITDDYDSYFSWTYNLNKYFVPSEVLEKMIQDGELFFFDIGGNGRPVWVEYEELSRCFRELGLVKG